jgi:hypothetical protein
MCNLIKLTNMFLLVMLMGCQVQNTATGNNMRVKNLMYQGTIKYMAVEGGMYGIITHKGERLLPMNLAKEYRQDGAVIKFSGHYVKDIVTIQQWGKPFTITAIKLISKGQAKDA